MTAIIQTNVKHSPEVDASLGSPVTSSAPRGNSRSLCRHFARGRCTWGAACRFSHSGDAVPRSDDANQKTGGGISVTAGGDVKVAGSPTSVMQQAAWIGAQQAHLQHQRHSILRAALEGHFSVRPAVGVDAVTHTHTIVLSSGLPAAEIHVTPMNEQQVLQQLTQLELDDRVQGGLHYLIGEASLFWSMIRLFHLTGTTTSAKWDGMLEKAKKFKVVECMFFRSGAGCLAPNCPFEHVPKVTSVGSSLIRGMVTSNEALQRVPSLGFGSSNDRLDAMASSDPWTDPAVQRSVMNIRQLLDHSSTDSGLPRASHAEQNVPFDFGMISSQPVATTSIW